MRIIGASRGRINPTCAKQVKGTGVGLSMVHGLASQQPLAVPKMPLRILPRSNRFGSPLELSRVHWAKPEMVVEIWFAILPGKHTPLCKKALDGNDERIFDPVRTT